MGFADRERDDARVDPVEIDLDRGRGVVPSARVAFGRFRGGVLGRSIGRSVIGGVLVLIIEVVVFILERFGLGDER